ncbi:MAG: Gfo/Idh/MocA family oxidoreductase [Planctomycetes bacterium]|nr:Gfo/Idh/MocA family oxidoreductase [Planctomycetota bacterium]
MARKSSVPELPYRPKSPRSKHAIALIGCGDITKHHLRAYVDAGFDVVMLCDLDSKRAKERQKEFYPKAKVTTDYREVLADTRVEVVDIATHPLERSGIIEDALDAKKHVLSQKPFVFDLNLGQRLVDKADAKGLRLAVNQNGRFAPHMAWIREAVQAGLVGDVFSVHVGQHWDHDWIVGTPFEMERHIILYDFAIHWFDFVATLLPMKRARRVVSTLSRGPAQQARPALLGQCLIEYEGAQVSLVFDGAVHFAARDRTYVAGTKGALISEGTDHRDQVVTLVTASGEVRPELEGSWFPGGFHGTMAELLCAIEDGYEPMHSARNNLDSLALCFAAVSSADQKQSMVPGSVRRLPGAIG